MPSKPNRGTPSRAGRPRSVGDARIMVPKARLELARASAHYPLKVARLPIPPLRHDFATASRMRQAPTRPGCLSPARRRQKPMAPKTRPGQRQGARQRPASLRPAPWQTRPSQRKSRRKLTASQAVALTRKDAEPLLPNMVFDAPEPNAAPRIGAAALLQKHQGAQG